MDFDFSNDPGEVLPMEAYTTQGFLVLRQKDGADSDPEHVILIPRSRAKEVLAALATLCEAED